MLVAVNLRPPVTSLGALLSDVQRGLQVGSALAGALTSVPTLVFGAAGLMVPCLTRRLAIGPAVTAGMLAVVAGTALRVTGSVSVLLAGTLVAMSGVAVVNVLLPVVVRSGFPSREGWMTGAYVSVIQFGGAAGASLAVPVTSLAGGWRAGLALWAVPAVVGLVAWVLVGDTGPSPSSRGDQESTLSWGRLVRDRTALAVTTFFGLQSALAYVVFGWLPTILRDAGVRPAASGTMLAVAIAVSVPFSLVLPGWLAARRDQRGATWLIVGAWGAGFGGLALAPTTSPWLWAVLLGVGLSGFPVGLLLMGLRSATTADTTRVSAFAQGIGYLVALPAPVLFGVAFGHPGGREVALWGMVALLVPLAWSGWRAGLPGHVGDAPRGAVATR